MKSNQPVCFSLFLLVLIGGIFLGSVLPLSAQSSGTSREQSGKPPATPPVTKPHPTPPRPTPTPEPPARPPRVIVVPNNPPPVVVNNTTVVQQTGGPANTLSLSYPRSKLFMRYDGTSRSITVDNHAQGKGVQPIVVYDYTFNNGPNVHWESNAVMPGRDLYEFWVRYPNRPTMKVDIVYYGTPVTVWNDGKLLITLGFEKTPL